MPPKDVWTCSKCGTLNPPQKNQYQSVKCFNCEHRHAIVRDGDQKRYLPFWQQSREATSTDAVQAQQETNAGQQESAATSGDKSAVTVSLGDDKQTAGLSSSIRRGPGLGKQN